MQAANLTTWLAELGARLDRHDHAGAMSLLVERSSELLALQGGPESLVAFLADAHRRGRASGVHDAWTLLLDADLAALIDGAQDTLRGHALATFAALLLDRHVDTRPCARCGGPRGEGGDPLARLARGCHFAAAGRFLDAVAELDPAHADAQAPSPLRAAAGLVAAQVVLRCGEPIEGRRRFEALAPLCPEGTGLALLIEIHLLRALLSAGEQLERVRARAAELRDGDGPAIVRELARRLHAFAAVMLGQAPGELPFEASPEAHLDAAEVAVLAGQRVPLPPLLAIAGACERDGRAYLEARARIAAAYAGFAHDDDVVRARAAQEVSRARRLCDAHGYPHLSARCDLLLAIVADGSRAPTDHERRLETVLERAPSVTMLERIAESVLHRRPAQQLAPGDARLLSLLGHSRLPAYSVDDGTGARLVGALDLERWRGRADLVIDLDRSELVARGRVVRGQARLVAVLAHLVSAGARPVEADELFRAVWNARTYTPLRHRNAVYLAISRTRRVLAPLLGGPPIERHPGGWRVQSDLYAIVVRAVPGDARR